MNEVKELNENDLKKVVGGTDESEKIDYVKGLISQIISEISIIENNLIIQTVIQEFNFAITLLNDGSLQSAKDTFKFAFERIASCITPEYDKMYSNVTDIYYEILYTMNWN